MWFPSLRKIGYDEHYTERWSENAIDMSKIKIINLIGRQSADILQGVNAND